MRAVIPKYSLSGMRGEPRLKVNLLWCFAQPLDESGRALHHIDCCLSPDEGRTRSALLAKKDKPFQSRPAFDAGVAKKARSVVALSRVPR